MLHPQMRAAEHLPARQTSPPPHRSSDRTLVSTSISAGTETGALPDVALAALRRHWRESQPMPRGTSASVSPRHHPRIGRSPPPPRRVSRGVRSPAAGVARSRRGVTARPSPQRRSRDCRDSTSSDGTADDHLEQGQAGHIGGAHGHACGSTLPPLHPVFTSRRGRRRSDRTRDVALRWLVCRLDARNPSGDARIPTRWEMARMKQGITRAPDC